MSSRYVNKKVLLNNNPQYSNVFKNKGLIQINHFNTPSLRYPTSEEIESLDFVAHTWAVGDRLYKLAFKHYGDAELWWVIAWYNQLPTESHIQIGQAVYVPLPLDKILNLLDV